MFQKKQSPFLRFVLEFKPIGSFGQSIFIDLALILLFLFGSALVLQILSTHSIFVTATQ